MSHFGNLKEKVYTYIGETYNVSTCHQASARKKCAKNLIHQSYLSGD